MKLLVKLSVSILLCYFYSFILTAQICYKYHENCLFADWEFYYSRQSASTLFKPNQISSLSFFANGGEKYYISVCGEKKFKNIKFRIYEEDNPSAILYDNSLDHYNETITFINEYSRNLIVEVTAPTLETKKDPENQKYCIGVLIQFAEIRVDLSNDNNKTGF